MRYLFFKKSFYLIVLLFSITTTVFACPCYNRAYLYSLFYSDKIHSDCSLLISKRPDSARDRIIFITSHMKGSGPRHSYYGEASSHELKCILIIEDQMVLFEYKQPEEKDSCDEEIISACKMLMHS